MPIFMRIWASKCLYLRWIWASRHENRHRILMPISTKNMGTPLWKWYEFRDLDACKTIHHKIQVVVSANYLVKLQLHDLLSFIIIYANSKNTLNSCMTAKDTKGTNCTRITAYLLTAQNRSVLVSRPVGPVWPERRGGPILWQNNVQRC